MLIGCQYFNAPILGCYLDNRYNRYIEFAPIKFKGQNGNLHWKKENFGPRYNMLFSMAITTPYFMFLYIWPPTIIHRKNNSISQRRGQTRNRFRTFLTKNVENKFSLDIIKIGFTKYPIIVFSWFIIIENENV